MLGTVVAALCAGTALAQDADLRLVTAMRNQDVAAARTLLSEGVGVNVQDSDTATALHWAAHWNDAEAARMLLDAGAEPNAQNRFGVTALHLAAVQHNEQLIEAMLDAGADPNAAYGDGETAFMSAARAGHAGVVRLMIQHGADVTAAESWHGQTALMWAVQENHADAVSVMVDAGADINRRSTAHDWIKIDYSSGNVPKTRDLGGLTPLHFAARHGSIDAASVLIAAGADLNAPEPMYQLTPLQTAVVNGYYQLATKLVEAGADVNDGSLYLAIDTRNLGFYAQRPNPPAKDGSVSNLDIVNTLLAAGADPNLPYTKGIPERTVAGQITAPAGATPLDRAAVGTDVDAIRVLTQHGADVNTAAADGVTPLMLLSGLARGRARTTIEETPELLDAIRTILVAGADPDRVHPESGNTALHFAAGLHADRLVNELAQYGADGNIVNHDGQTAWALIEGADFVSGASPARP
jgi:ankyrin repeat protein